MSIISYQLYCFPGSSSNGLLEYFLGIIAASLKLFSSSGFISAQLLGQRPFLPVAPGMATEVGVHL